MSEFFERIQIKKNFFCVGGGGGRGLELVNFFLQRIKMTKIKKKKIVFCFGFCFFSGGGGGGGGLE